jgi:hypothetical protein
MVEWAGMSGNCFSWRKLEVLKNKASRVFD